MHVRVDTCVRAFTLVVRFRQNESVQTSGFTPPPPSHFPQQETFNHSKGSGRSLEVCDNDVRTFKARVPRAVSGED